MNGFKEFWANMPWFAKLGAIGMLAIAWIAITLAKGIPATIETLEAKVEAHSAAAAVANLEATVARKTADDVADESLRLLRSMCVSLAVMSKTDQTKCF